MEVIIEALNAGDITWLGGLMAIVGGLIAGVAGGAVGGLLVGREHLGTEVALMLGSFYGPIAAVPGILVAILLVLFI